MSDFEKLFEKIVLDYTRPGTVFLGVDVLKPLVKNGIVVWVAMVEYRENWGDSYAPAWRWQTDRVKVVVDTGAKKTGCMIFIQGAVCRDTPDVDDVRKVFINIAEDIILNS